MKYDPLIHVDDLEERDTTFWRDLAIVVAVHAALIGMLLLWVWWGKKTPEKIVWLDGGGELGAPAPPPAGGKPGASTTPPPEEAEAPLPPLPKEVEPPKPPPTPPREERSEFAEKKPEPTPKPTPRPTPKPEAKPKPDPTPRPKAPPTPEPKKTTPVAAKKPKTPTPEPAKVAKPATKPSPKPPVTTAKLATPKPSPGASDSASTDSPKVTREGSKGTGDADTNATTGAGKATAEGTKGGPGSLGGAALAQMQDSYVSRVGAEFKNTNEAHKPRSAENGENQVYTPYIRFKILKDGSVITSSLIRPSGNVLVDNWVRETIELFKSAPPPPAALLKDGAFEMILALEYAL